MQNANYYLGKYNWTIVQPVETRLVARYNITNTVTSTALVNFLTNISGIEVDGVEEVEIESSYMFTTSGIHTVKYTLTNATTMAESMFEGIAELVSVEIPNSVTIVNDTAFGGCTGLTSCTIGNGVTTIDGGAFIGCTNLVNVSIPSGVTSIGDNTFQNCSGLTTIEIPSGITSIGRSAFQGCSGLTSITINASTPPTFGDYVFNDTNLSLKMYVPSPSFMLYVNVLGGEWSDMLHSIPNTIQHPYQGLCLVTLKNGETYEYVGSTNSLIQRDTISFDDLMRTKFNSDNIDIVEIGTACTHIDNSAFESCTGITSLIISSSVTNINDSAFAGCSSITSITSNAATAPTIYSGTFINVHAGGTLTVPTGSTGYNVWMGTGNYYLGKYNWTKVEQ
jgi:hypothetical protein